MNAPLITVILLAAPLLLAQPGTASELGGDWPCIQRKIPAISLAAVWSGPPIGAAAFTSWRDDRTIASLVELLAARRTPMDAAETAIAALAASSGAERTGKLSALFAGLFETLNDERAGVMAGVERYGHRQKQLAAQLRKQADAIAEERRSANADPGKIDDMNDRLVWDTRIFDERQKSLSYVCEVPVLIDQRLFALGRVIAGHLE